MIKHHIDTPSDLYAVLARDGSAWKKPVRRILHLLIRKAKLKTLFIERNPPCGEYLDECKIDSALEPEQCVRLHFFAARIETEADIAQNRQSYCGYCDVRPDGTIAKCHITRTVIIRPDSYAFLVCQITEAVGLPAGEKLDVTGFSHVEKNGRGLMCSQAAMANIVHYWNSKAPGTFSATTATAISLAAGVSSEQLLNGDFGGLSFPAVKQFFVNQGFNVHTVGYWEKNPTQIAEEDPGVTIYGFLESGFPVIAVVKTAAENHHALTVVGHTFDKNIWSAFAGPYYFSEPLTGGGCYHSNSAWVKYFIVQDDNLGPYFFVPRDELASIIQAIIVPMPFPRVVVEPKEAERAAFKALSLLVEKQRFEKDKRLLGANREWLRLFRNHYDPKDNEGWVLRPFLRTLSQVEDFYSNHEFGPILSETLSAEDPGAIFWIVELSWPNLYCYDERKVGEIILDAFKKTPLIIHLPGVLAFPTTNKIVFAQNEDGPSPCYSGTKGA